MIAECVVGSMIGDIWDGRAEGGVEGDLSGGVVGTSKGGTTWRGVHHDQPYFARDSSVVVYKAGDSDHVRIRREKSIAGTRSEQKHRENCETTQTGEYNSRVC